MRMKPTLYILLAALLLSGCKLTKEERRMNRATKKLEKLTAKYPELVRTDTIRDTLHTNRVHIDTTFVWQSDTVEVYRDNLRVRIVRLPGNSILIDAECDTVFVPVQVPCDTIQPVRYEPSEKQRQKTDRWRTVALVFIAISVVLGLGYWFR